MQAEIAIIGGTGVYDSEILKESKSVVVDTPYGKPSDEITLGVFEGRGIAILPRHGKSHTIPPHKINYRANIHALKSLGVQRIVSPCAVGSLREGVKPGDFVFADQFIDMTRRVKTFYDEGKVCHLSVAEPFCPELRELFIRESGEFSHHTKGTYVCIEGPQFSTKAESRMYQSWADVVGMTLMPEAVLAREAEICYIPIAMVTDWDVWKEEPVTIEMVLETMKTNTEKVRSLLARAIPSIPTERNCSCKEALKGAFV